VSLSRQAQLLAGLLGFTAVIMAAVGSHLVTLPGQEAAMRSWQAANHMHLLHSVALLALSALSRNEALPLLRWAAWSWAGGVILFSGSIYVELLLNLPGNGGIAPVGGSLLILGWVLLGIGSARART